MTKPRNHIRPAWLIRLHARWACEQVVASVGQMMALMNAQPLDELSSERLFHQVSEPPNRRPN